MRWEPLGPAEVVPDLKHLRRLVRYLALNPCRAGLADDPLRWPWSTHRDVAGAIVDPWIDADRLAAALGLPARGFAEAHHRYVSASGSVSTASTRFPCRAEPVDVAVQPLAALAAAAAAATRTTPADIRREGPTRALFLQLAGRHGWRRTGQLAAMCGIHPASVRWNLRQQPDPAALAAGELCLGDARLLTWQAPQHRSLYARKAKIDEAIARRSASICSVCEH
ncbi:MAG: hypothetical protein HY744_29935 [Deltaproteobacteria bacterium]|nr:hypothetical protein [Deltaproteobacteria bacterium]